MPSRRPRARPARLRTSAIGLGSAALLAVGASVALAHDPLAATDGYVPANGAVVTGDLPAKILVNFQDTFHQAGDAGNATVPIAKIIDTAGADHVASAEQNPGNAKQLVITTKDRTTPGRYTVTWTITASDGHAVSNDGSDVSEEGAPLVFTVAGVKGSAAATSTVTGKPKPATSSSNTVLAAVTGIVLVILIGAGAILFWRRRRRDEFSGSSDR